MAVSVNFNIPRIMIDALGASDGEVKTAIIKIASGIASAAVTELFSRVFGKLFVEELARSCNSFFSISIERNCKWVVDKMLNYIESTQKERWARVVADTGRQAIDYRVKVEDYDDDDDEEEE